MSRKVLALIAVLALALAILTGLAVRKGVLGPQPQTAAVGGPFQLTDTNGRTVDQSVLKGKWSVVFFGYTHCPDVCPTTLFELAQVEPLLGPRARDFQTVSSIGFVRGGRVLRASAPAARIAPAAARIHPRCLLADNSMLRDFARSSNTPCAP